MGNWKKFADARNVGEYTPMEFLSFAENAEQR